ncbi:MAG TPA: hypothetical protein VLT33_47085, partial [Labilithrix sp.]|nr:hypothetical protein [Labilithrix sp.]
MSARPGGTTALRILGAAFAASALLVVLQTVVYQLLAYDSSSFGRVAVVFRVAFWLADLGALVGLIALGPASPRARALPATGALLAAGVVLFGAVGLGASALGSDATTLRSLSAMAGYAEPMWTIGVAVLATLAAGELARPHGPEAIARARRLMLGVGILVALAMAFRLGRLAVP